MYVLRGRTCLLPCVYVELFALAPGTEHIREKTSNHHKRQHREYLFKNKKETKHYIFKVRGAVLFMNKAADVSGTSWTPHAHSHRKSPIVVTSVMVWHVSLRSAISPSMLLTSCSWSPSSFLQEHLSVPPPHGGQTEFCMMYIREVAPTELARCMRSCVCPVRLTQPWI